MTTVATSELVALRAEVERKETELVQLRESLAQASEDALRLREALRKIEQSPPSLTAGNYMREIARAALARNAIRPMTEPIPTTCERQDCNEPVVWILHWEERGAPEPAYACWTHGMRSAVRREPVARSSRLSR